LIKDVLAVSSPASFFLFWVKVTPTIVCARLQKTIETKHESDNKLQTILKAILYTVDLNSKEMMFTYK